MKDTKILDFKTVSPLFEMERDGIKPFTERKVDHKDSRFRALVQTRPYRATTDPFPKNWTVRITNPATGESFIRELLNWQYFPRMPADPDSWDYNGDWMILYLGEDVKL